MARKLIPILFFTLSGAVVTLAVWVLLYGSQPTKPAKPVLTFTPETIHFGTVEQGIEHGKAIVTNVSAKPVVIKAVTKGVIVRKFLSNRENYYQMSNVKLLFSGTPAGGAERMLLLLVLFTQYQTF